VVSLDFFLKEAECFRKNIRKVCRKEKDDGGPGRASPPSSP
jgi:hypothetical protein